MSAVHLYMWVAVFVRVTICSQGLKESYFSA